MRFESPEHFADARRDLAGIPGIASVEADERALTLTAVPTSGGAALPAVSDLIIRKGWQVAELHLESGRLDEVFRTITRPDGPQPVRP